MLVDTCAIAVASDSGSAMTTGLCELITEEENHPDGMSSASTWQLESFYGRSPDLV